MVKQVRPARVRRRRERGTTLFVVVLAITMLTGIGLYTVRSAALLARAAGNERQATQTEYLAQIGGLASLAQASIAPEAYIKQALRGSTSNGNTVDDCRMNLGVDTTKSVPPPCYEFSSSKFALLTGNALFDGDSFGTAIDPSTGVAAISGAFHTEMTDVAPSLQPIPGMDANNHNFTFYEAKLTTIAALQPAAATAACVQNVMQVAGQHLTRAHILIGPVGGN